MTDLTGVALNFNRVIGISLPIHKNLCHRTDWIRAACSYHWKSYTHPL